MDAAVEPATPCRAPANANAWIKRRHADCRAGLAACPLAHHGEACRPRHGHTTATLRLGGVVVDSSARVSMLFACQTQMGESR